MRVLFCGAGAFGLPTLEALARTHSVVGVVTQPDRPAGRGRALTPTPIGAWATANLPGCPVLRPPDVNEPAAMSEVRALAGPGRADAWVVIAFGQKLSRPLLDGVFACNLHASLLPRWRGAAPINAAILAGDTETGNTVITLADRMDAGLILAQSRRPIERLQTAGELHDLLAADGPQLVLHVLEACARGMLAGVPQDERLATRARKLTKADGLIDFARHAPACRAQIHALTPWPGVAITLGDLRLKVLRVCDEAAPGLGVPPGTLVDPVQGLLACGFGTWLRLLEVQPAGGRAMRWEELVRGRRLDPGLVAGGSTSAC